MERPKQGACMNGETEMKAIVIREFGGRDKLELADVPEPGPPGPGEVLIRIKAAGVNPVDCKIREGLLKDRLPHEFPLIPGWDAAGIVEAVGDGVTRLTLKDEVYAYCRKPVVKDGAYAEHILLPAENVTVKPFIMPFAQAATVPLSALTAYQSLFDAAQLQEGESVLIHAAAGGVGTYAIQLAKSRHSTIYGTACTANHDYIQQLGVEFPIDYTKRDFRKQLRRHTRKGVDVVFDTVGGDTLTQSLDILKKGGRIVSIVDPDQIQALTDQGINAHYVFVQPNAVQLQELSALIEKRQLRAHLSAVLPLKDAAAAHEMIESQHTRGKIVLQL